MRAAPFHRGLSFVCAQSAVAYAGPVAPAMFGPLASVLLLVGFALTALFFLNPISHPSGKGAEGGSRGGLVGFVSDVVIAAAAAAFLGFGCLFLFLFAGIFV